MLLYTSASTWPPKGVKIAANFLVAIDPHLVHGANAEPDDVFWPTGDPGWGYGLVCDMGARPGGAGALAPGRATRLLRRAGARAGVTNLAMMPPPARGDGPRRRAAGGGDAARAQREQLRRAPERGGGPFFREHWGVTVRDQYGSSEFGLPIGNFATVEMAVKPGSMGLPLPGCKIAVVDDAGREVGPDVVGHVGTKPHPKALPLGYGTTRTGPARCTGASG